MKVKMYPLIERLIEEGIEAGRYLRKLTAMVTEENS
jgi:hypothetical protein